MQTIELQKSHTGLVKSWQSCHRRRKKLQLSLCRNEKWIVTPFMSTSVSCWYFGNCCHILTQCRLSLKPLGRPHMYNRNVIFLSRWWTFHTQIHVHLSCGLPTWQATLFQISKCKYAVKIQHGEKVSLFWQTILTSGYQSFKCLNHPS